MMRLVFLIGAFFAVLTYLASGISESSASRNTSTKLRGDAVSRLLLNRYSPRALALCSSKGSLPLPWKGRDVVWTCESWEPERASWSFQDSNSEEIWTESISWNETFADPETKRQFLSTQVQVEWKASWGKKWLSKWNALFFGRNSLEKEVEATLLNLPAP